MIALFAVSAIKLEPSFAPLTLMSPTVYASAGGFVRGVAQALSKITTEKMHAIRIFVENK